MAQSFSTQSLQDLLIYPFRVSNWKQKLLITCLVTLSSYIIPILPLLLLSGYSYQLMRDIILEDKPPFLPEWADWGKLLTNGLKLFGASIIYSLPTLILLVVGYGLMLVPVIVPEIAESTDFSVPTNMDFFLFSGIFLGMHLVLGTIMGILISVVVPAALCHVAVQDKFAAAFYIRKWWPIFRANLSGFFISFVILMGIWFVASFALQLLYITIVLCCLVPFVLSFISTYIMLISSTLFAQAYRTGVQNLAK